MADIQIPGLPPASSVGGSDLVMITQAAGEAKHCTVDQAVADHADVSANTTHRGAGGTDHADLMHRSCERVDKTGAAIVLEESDNGKTVTVAHSDVCEVTVPDTLSANFQCVLAQVGVGATSLARSGVELINGAAANVPIEKQWAALYLTRLSPTTWLAVA